MEMKRFFLPPILRKMRRPLAFDTEKDKQEAREKITDAKKCVQTAKQKLTDAIELSQAIESQKPSPKRKKEGERVVKKYLYQAKNEAYLAVYLLTQAVRLYPGCKEFVLADSFEARLHVEDAVILLRHPVWAYFGLDALVDDIEKAVRNNPDKDIEPVFQNLLAYAYTRRSFVATHLISKNTGAPFLIIDMLQPAADLEKSCEIYASLGNQGQASRAGERMNKYLFSLFNPPEL